MRILSLMAVIILYLNSFVYCATRNICPRADGEGNLGVAGQAWGNANIKYGLNIATVVASGNVSAATVNTGQGSYELYAMNQNVLTTSSPTFSQAFFYGGGNVGIGTTNPLDKLEVAGNVFVSGGNRVGINIENPGQLLGVSASIEIGNTIFHIGDGDTYRDFPADDDQTFAAGGEILLQLKEAAQDYVKLGDGGDVDCNFNDDMFIEGSSGNVGIGTTVVTVSKLVVIGTVTAQGFVQTCKTPKNKMGFLNKIKAIKPKESENNDDVLVWGNLDHDTLPQGVKVEKPIYKKYWVKGTDKVYEQPYIIENGEEIEDDTWNPGEELDYIFKGQDIGAQINFNVRTIQELYDYVLELESRIEVLEGN